MRSKNAQPAACQQCLGQRESSVGKQLTSLQPVAAHPCIVIKVVPPAHQGLPRPRQCQRGARQGGSQGCHGCSVPVRKSQW